MSTSGGIKLNEQQVAYLAQKLGISPEQVSPTSLKTYLRKLAPDFPADLPRGGNKRKKSESA